MTAFCKVYGPRFALGGALLVSACQHDSGASFDDSKLTSPGSDTGGSSSTGGSDAEAGTTSQGAASAGGSQASAGSNAAGKTNGGASASAGSAAGGSGGVASGGGKAGMDAGGVAGQAGKGGTGGSAGVAGMTGMAGMAGAKNDPVTIDIGDCYDTYVESCMPGMNHGEAISMNVDADDSCVVQSLIRPPLTQIPDGAVVNEATLTLTCINVGDPATVYYANEDWVEDEVRWNTKPAVGMVLGTVSCTVLGKVTIDLKVAVKAWLAGTHGDYGIYLRMETSDGTDFSTSEADKGGDRPKLTVTYTLPAK